MDVVATNTSLNSTFRQQSVKAETGEASVAFGIGAKPQVELSAQAKILQQTEQNLQTQQASRQVREPEQKDPEQQASNEYVRVSSSVGPAAQSNNLSTDKATELYRSIEKML
ncbi:hypothetical protein [Bowmanella yangjiangensis]|uniref:Uncharacterized protein n=1 Tax=Bowmanella yangjiangensis TaxID=2811230 RepID=A0ABS3CYS7_9ALTE|nr:hypothetical protein [Bowmanella yangjiangensis]MBN7821485.1 hypothetical protein [Bowmanella yangjiangensis]